MKISVIIPIYNVEIYLKKCVESVINQTYNNLEIILVDDGSTDNSSTICDEYQKKDNRIRVVHKKNGGLSSARNIGLNIATGELIGFVDSDDYIESNMYELLYNNMTKYDSDISICDINYLDTKIEKNYLLKEFKVTGKEKFDNLKNEYSILAYVAWNKLYRRELFNIIKYPYDKQYEDKFIICELLEKAKIVSYIIEPLYNHIKREDSITNKISIRSLNWIDAYNNNISFFQLKKYYDLEYLEKIEKCNTSLWLITKLKAKGFFSKEDSNLFCKYYLDILNTCKSIKWKDSNKYVKRFKVFKRYYILSRSFALGLYYKIKSII